MAPSNLRLRETRSINRAKSEIALDSRVLPEILLHRPNLRALNRPPYSHRERVRLNVPVASVPEVQIDNVPTHDKRTGSVYAVSDVVETHAQDGKWFHVQGKHVVIKLDDQVVVDWTFKNFKVRPLPAK